LQHCLRDICADDVQPEISKESSRSTGSAAEVERARAVVIVANQGRQIAKREIVRSRKLKRRIRARPFLIFVHVAECGAHPETFGLAGKNNLNGWLRRLVRLCGVSCVDIEEENLSVRPLDHQPTSCVDAVDGAPMIM